MGFANIMGLETEYGIVLQDRGELSQEHLSGMLVDAFIRSTVKLTNGGSLMGGQYVDFMLPNGARFYVDHGHPEYSTPECRTPQDVIACDRAGEKILLRSAELVNSKLPDGQQVQIFKNNTDHRGSSYGCHENYLVSANIFEELFKPQSDILYRHLIPFLVTRQIYAGGGKVGSENGTQPVDYQISQRADFFETIIGIQTTSRRPIINTRNEPHADAGRFRRFHVILGDANLCEVAALLKVGTTQLILQMLEDNTPLPDLILDDPVSALHDVSHDAGLSGKIKLANGQSISPIDMQEEFRSAAEKYLQSVKQSGWEQQTMADWKLVLTHLYEKKEALIGKIDWITKKALIESYIHKSGEPWDSPLIAEMDIRYHNIDPAQSHFHFLKDSEIVETRIPENDIHYFTENPPTDTRAYFRGECMQHFVTDIGDADWSYIVIGPYNFSLPEPHSPGKSEVGKIMKQVDDRQRLASLIDYFNKG